ncbi:HAD family hydrolase [Bacteroides sedimenti]|uniref:Phosphoglycolate phosphatase n=1 Tax=Bacteroides sedimenti TaxID=2136147 RepID=A0ABN6Z6U8_9BACE
MKKEYQYILFDLDGTISDPATGITRSIQYALSFFEITVPNPEELTKFIGPPLIESFKEFYHFNDDQALLALKKYREYFVAKGMFENYLYKGIEELLQTLKEKGKTILLATSKPEPFAKQILEHFNLTHYFSFIGGATLDGSRSTKTDVIRYVLKSNQITEPGKTVMVGDREHDIEGAKNNGITSIGVLYGYGSKTELQKAGADFLASDIKELMMLL